jgi:hypothetical protein
MKLGIGVANTLDYGLGRWLFLGSGCAVNRQRWEPRIFGRLRTRRMEMEGSRRGGFPLRGLCAMRVRGVGSAIAGH